MSIERDSQIKFHELGTLNAVTRWISSHDEGIAEWLKNARRAYQLDRANVDEKHRAAVLIAKDAHGTEPARIGLLDVGGATLEDVTAWSTWQDPEASRRFSHLDEEETQGNGGKTYMFKLFTGPCRIVGVRDGKRNCKGFEGATGSVDRGTPGFVPDLASGREVPVSSIRVELDRALKSYGIAMEDLPAEVRSAVEERQAFTLVEGEDPVDLYKGRVDHEDLIVKVLRQDQSTLAIQQLRLYAAHNGRLVNEGKPLELPPIEPYPELEGPFVHEIPEELPLTDGGLVSTTDSGRRPKGRLILFTCRENMYHAYKNLRPRWRITYRTQHQMIGSKVVAELTPSTPGAYFVYGTVELSALEPGYVDHGRRRPKAGPLVEALDLFVAEKIRELAKQISQRRSRDLDDRALDEVQDENEKLDLFKNKFLPSDGEGDGGMGGDGMGPGQRRSRGVPEYGTIPESIELLVAEEGLRIGRDVKLHLNEILQLRVVDASGKPVRAPVAWHSSDVGVARFTAGDLLEPRDKGKADVWAVVKLEKGKEIESDHVPVHVWVVDHVLLTPRAVEIPLRKRQQIIAEVTDDEGNRSTDVYLDWKHDADDQLIVRIGPAGYVTGNRLGRTAVNAGAGDAAAGGMWARIPVEVTVVPNPETPGRGGGFPRLLLTGRDLDPATGNVRKGDPDSPALWQEASDFTYNVWWLNLQSPEARFAFGERQDNPGLWRDFHAQIVMEMVVQVYMMTEFTKRGENEQEQLWASHQNALDRHRVRIVQQMWEQLEPYVHDGGGLA